MLPTDNTPQPRVSGRTRDMVIAADRFILWFSKHWLFAFNTFIAVYIGLPMLAPVLMHYGLEGPANLIYLVYSPLCHQLGYRSWFLFGEQAAYPRDVFQQFTGINPDDLWGARGFIGNVSLGFKMALCQRDIGIYLTMFFGGLIYGIGLVRKTIKPLPIWAWVLIGIIPIGVDGFTQLFTQYPYHQFPLFSWLPQRESTPILRTITGALFGLANIWLAYPHVQESMREVADEVAPKLARVDAEQKSAS